jgi:hypothetical protein
VQAGTTRRFGAWEKRRVQFLLPLLLVLLTGAAAEESRAAEAASAVITGVVLSEEDHQPLPNSRVGVYRVFNPDSGYTLVTGMLTEADGRFRLPVAPATYRVIFSYQSFSVLSKDDVVVGPGATVELSITLTPKPLQMKGVEVKGDQIRGTEVSALKEQKKAAFVSDAITAEQISKSTDSNAAEALQRVTGLSVVGGRYVYVRGLGERYSSTQVNGASIGTPEPNKRVVPLDVFSSGALDEITVQKTYTPDQEGEFAGGVIQLKTRDFASGTGFTQKLSTGYSAGILDRKFLTYRGGSLDFLGFDDGARDLPDVIRKYGGGGRLPPLQTRFAPGLTQEQLQEVSRGFSKNFWPEGKGGSPNYSYSASYGHAFDVLGRRVGFLASGSLSNSFTNIVRDLNAYRGTSTNLYPFYQYQVHESSRHILGGGMANLGAQIARGHKIQLRSLYTRQTDDNARITAGPNQDYGTDLVQITSLDFVQRGVFSTVLSGEHLFERLQNFGVDWKASYSASVRDEPDRRESLYESDGNGGIKLSGRNAPLTYVFGHMNEYDRSAQVNFTQPFQLLGRDGGRFRMGAWTRTRNRVSEFRRFLFKAPRGSDSVDTHLPPESLLVDANIDRNVFLIEELTRANDTYRARQGLNAAYVMGELPVLDRLRLMGGARVERSRQSVDTRSPFVTTAVATDALLEGTDLLPALNATYRVTETMNVRCGYSVTLSRPELRELSPFDMYDYETGYSEVGNPDIKSTRIQNYDARWELYPGSRELFAVSAFRKTLFQPIENIVEGSGGGYILSPRNGRDGRLSGFEVEARTGFRRIWDGLDRVLPIPRSTSALERWALTANYSHVESRVRVRITTDPTGRPIYREGPLQGQSSYALNLGLHFGAERVEASLLYAAFGKRLAQVGAGAYPNPLPDIYEHPLNSFDFTFAKRINHLFRLKGSVENLLDRSDEFLQLDKVTRRVRPGRSFGLSLDLKS